MRNYLNLLEKEDLFLITSPKFVNSNKNFNMKANAVKLHHHIHYDELMYIYRYNKSCKEAGNKIYNLKEEFDNIDFEKRIDFFSIDVFKWFYLLLNLLGITYSSKLSSDVIKVKLKNNRKEKKISFAVSHLNKLLPFLKIKKYLFLRMYLNEKFVTINLRKLKIKKIAFLYYYTFCNNIYLNYFHSPQKHLEKSRSFLVSQLQNSSFLSTFVNFKYRNKLLKRICKKIFLVYFKLNHFVNYKENVLFFKPIFKKEFWDLYFIKYKGWRIFLDNHKIVNYSRPLLWSPFFKPKSFYTMKRELAKRKKSISYAFLKKASKASFDMNFKKIHYFRLIFIWFISVYNEIWIFVFRISFLLWIRFLCVSVVFVKSSNFFLRYSSAYLSLGKIYNLKGYIGIYFRLIMPTSIISGFENFFNRYYLLKSSFKLFSSIFWFLNYEGKSLNFRVETLSLNMVWCYNFYNRYKKTVSTRQLSYRL